MLLIRRIYLQEISDSPGKRAAFEILTELPIDWDKASRREPQADEPWRKTNQRQPDMILLAESGWSWGECGYGPDRKAQAQGDRRLSRGGGHGAGGMGKMNDDHSVIPGVVDGRRPLDPGWR